MTQALRDFIETPPPGVNVKNILRKKCRMDRYIEKQIKKEDDKKVLNSLLDKARNEVRDLVKLNQSDKELHDEILNEAIRIIQRLKFDLLKIRGKSKLEKNYFEICRKLREDFNMLPLARNRYFIHFIDEESNASKSLVSHLRIGIPEGSSECCFMYDEKDGLFTVHRTLNVHHILSVKIVI